MGQDPRTNLGLAHGIVSDVARDQHALDASRTEPLEASLNIGSQLGVASMTLLSHKDVPKGPRGIPVSF